MANIVWLITLMSLRILLFSAETGAVFDLHMEANEIKWYEIG